MVFFVREVLEIESPLLRVTRRVAIYSDIYGAGLLRCRFFYILRRIVYRGALRGLIHS